MANIIYNIRQLTNFDIQDYDVIGQYQIENIPDSALKDYVHIQFDKVVSKLGYCCEVRAIGYPIILYLENGTTAKIEVGKSGIFEFQPEIFINQFIDEEENINIENVELKINITGVDVPKDFTFTLDYAY